MEHERLRTRTIQRERTHKEKNARLAQTRTLTSSLAQQLIPLPRAPLCSTCPSGTAASYSFCALSKCGLFTSSTLQGAGLAAGPDGQAERDLVHEVSKVVQQVQSGRGDTAQQVPEEVPERVDRPTDCRNAAHGAEGGLHVLVHGTTGGVHLASLTVEDLVQDVPPPC